MNRSNLQSANKINDQIKSRESIIDYFLRYQKDNDPIRAVSELLTSCKNVGNETLKNQLAIFFMEKGVELMRNQIDELEKQFSELQ